MKKIFYTALTCASLFTACKTDDATPATTQRDVVLNYATIVSASYADAITGVQALKTAVDAFVKAPSATGLAACQKAWIDARPAYLQTEAYRFYDGPIDAEPAGLEGLINSWPLDEAYIDYVDGDANSGMINDLKTYPTITKDIIFNANGSEGETDVRVGYHAIEFLLWGQDFYATSAGQRTFTDYTTAKNATRRATYLQVVTNALIESLQAVATQWDSKTGTYYAQFTKVGNETTALTSILLGLGKLTKGELSGERMTVVLASGDQEDEHSCFSDNTHNDFIYDELGIYNVYLGRYKKTDGTTIDGAGFDDLVKAKNATQNTAMIAKLDAATTNINAIPKPFDQAILNSKTTVQAAIKSLREQSDQLVLVAKELGINLNVPEKN
ncbi:putative iron-regulated protein [Arcicella aurantiaca]|uniref:Putative iron-regulated protein n=1 Tax=Arcicella aurantiaca TaxID=591202 RepID=A0A316DQK2_9BACT|nr:imelysin family protein [Arcicella aurantiaca]PWK20076.1 putative iron-regulated protein [Arcicella aurantiaca]